MKTTLAASLFAGLLILSVTAASASERNKFDRGYAKQNDAYQAEYPGDPTHVNGAKVPNSNNLSLGTSNTANTPANAEAAKPADNNAAKSEAK